MERFFLCFYGGAGGNWLSNLTYLLENNENFLLQEQHNFHQTKKTNQFLITHYPFTNFSEYKYSLINNQKPKVFLNSFCSFNFFINYVTKLNYFADKNYDSSKILELTDHAIGSIYFSRLKKDLDYNLIFLNQEQFIKDFYKTLDNFSVKYSKNDFIFVDAIDKFKKTCINPNEIYKNYTNPIWLCWCLGILEISNKLKNIDKKSLHYDNINKIIDPHKKVIEKITNRLTLFYV